MITHTSGSYQILSQNKTKSKLQISKIAKNSNFEILLATLHATHLLKLLDEMYNYEMDPTRTVHATERTQGVGWTDGWTEGRTDGQMDGWMEWNQNTPEQIRCVWGFIVYIYLRLPF